jgi:predicted transcriptional regulator
VDVETIKARAVTDVGAGNTVYLGTAAWSTVAICTEARLAELDAANLPTVTDAILADTGTDGVVVATASKTGYGLAADGLDSIATTAPTTVASNFRQMLVQLWRRFFKKAVKNSTQIKTYADDGAIVVTTQTISDDGTTETQGPAS